MYIGLHSIMQIDFVKKEIGTYKNKQNLKKTIEINNIMLNIILPCECRHVCFK